MSSIFNTEYKTKSGYVAIVGRPNSGKSTLLNALLGSDLQIVSEKAQTTRWNTHGILTDDIGNQMIFIDTPGIHRAKVGGVNEAMVGQATQALKDDPTVIWYLVDPNSSLFHEQPVIDQLNALGGLVPLALVLNKTDLGLNTSWIERELAPVLKLKSQAFQISALNKSGVEELRAWSLEQLPLGPQYYNDPEQISDKPMKFFIGEAIREQVLGQLSDELPYSTAVLVEKVSEATKPMHVSASICVERESQKGILIGAKGAKIKSIGIMSRKKIEKLMDGQIHLELKVKVIPGWTKNKKELQKLGWVIQ
ncbi:MAG: GTPase Era [Xanthomonadaceae bacterium]|nr:GTPase Era [Xanthomonadaceae bacterium]